MRCRACGLEVDVSGAFPGAIVRCSCGASVTVLAPPAPEVHAYRQPAPPPHEAPSGGGATDGPQTTGMLTCPFCGGPCDASVRACPHCDVQLASVRCSSCYALHFT